MEPRKRTVAERYALGPALAAATVLAIGMGFGRFAFTGLYPLMVLDGHLTVHSGTLAASANYAGYLLGALAVARLKPEDARWLCIWSMFASVVCMGILTYADAAWFIIAVRGLAGIFSALTMVGASLWLLQHMGRAHGAPLLYSGVGVGIVVSAELIAFGQHMGLDSATLWMLLALCSLVAAVACIPALGGKPHSEPHFGHAAPGGSAARETSAAHALRLIAIYGLAGFGYIITATYLPLLIKDALGSINPIHVWAVFGLGAIPSCFFWHAFHVRLGTRNSLMLNLMVQAFGVVLPALNHSALAYLASAFLVGGTFTGTVTIAMPAARRLAHTVRFNMLAGMTAMYGVGQIVGPLIANLLYAGSQSFSGSLLAAGAALVVAAALCFGL